MAEKPRYINTTRLRELTGLSWYLFSRYRKLFIIAVPDAFIGTSPIWLSDKIGEIQRAIWKHESNATAAVHNANL